MLSFRDIDRDPGARTLRQFRVVLSVGALVIAVVLWLTARPAAATYVAISGAVLVLCSWLPRVGRWSYVAWMALGLALGRITSPVILGVVWLLVLTPLGLLLRLTGRDAMQRRYRPKSESYWQEHAQVSEPKRYFRQF